MSDRHVRVDLRRFHRRVAEQLLDVPQLGPAVEQAPRRIEGGISAAENPSSDWRGG
jgi:hypothetical protein